MIRCGLTGFDLRATLRGAAFFAGFFAMGTVVAGQADI